MIYYGIDERDQTLTHYGVKGMKWGVRKSRVASGVRKAGKKTKNQIAKVAGQLNEEIQYRRKRKQAVQAEVNKRLNDDRTVGNNKYAKKKRMQDLANRRTMSDADLRKNIERLRLEKQYKDMVMEDTSPVKSALSKTLKSVGEDAIRNTVKTGGAMALNSVASKGKTGAFLKKNNIDPSSIGNTIFGVQGNNGNQKSDMQKENERMQQEATNLELKNKLERYRQGDFSNGQKKKKNK